MVKFLPVYLYISISISNHLNVHLQSLYIILDVYIIVCHCVYIIKFRYIERYRNHCSNTKEIMGYGRYGRLIASLGQLP